MNSCVPQEVLLASTSTAVVDDLCALSKQPATNFCVSTNRNSYYTSSLVQSKSSNVVAAFYHKLGLRTHHRNDFVSATEILFCVISEEHRVALRSGKVTLSFSNITLFSKLVAENARDNNAAIVPAIAISPENNTVFLYHPQFDLDRDRWALGSRDNDKILVTEKELESFANVWSRFIDHTLKAVESGENFSPCVTLHRNSASGGIHVFIRNVNMRRKDQLELLKIASRDKILTQQLEQLRLKLDTPSNIFVPYAQKSGSRRLVYTIAAARGCEIDTTEPFPICVCDSCTTVVCKSMNEIERTRKAYRERMASNKSDLQFTVKKKDTRNRSRHKHGSSQRSLSSNRSLQQQSPQQSSSQTLSSQREKTAFVNDGECRQKQETPNSLQNRAKGQQSTHASSNCSLYSKSSPKSQRVSPLPNILPSASSDWFFQSPTYSGASAEKRNRSPTLSPKKIRKKSDKKCKTTAKSHTIIERIPPSPSKSSLIESVGGVSERDSECDNYLSPQPIETTTGFTNINSPDEIELSRECFTFSKPANIKRQREKNYADSSTSKRSRQSTSQWKTLEDPNDPAAVLKPLRNYAVDNYDSETPSNCNPKFLIREPLPSMDEAIRASFGSLDRFLPEKMIPVVFGQNVLCQAVFEHTFSLMFKEFNYVLCQPGMCGVNRRYSCNHLTTLLVTYGVIIWDRHPDAKRFGRPEKDFNIALTHTIVSLCAQRAEEDLNPLWDQLHPGIEAMITPVRAFVTLRTPTLAEVIFSMLHVALWSSASQSRDGLPCLNGEYIFNCPMIQGVLAVFLADQQAFLSRGNIVRDLCHDKPEKKLKHSAQAQALQSVLENSKDSQVLERLVGFLLALAHPYDGKLYWSSSIYPTWVPITEENYKARVLLPALTEINKLVTKCVNPDVPPLIKKNGTEIPVYYKLVINQTYFLSTITGLWQPLHPKMQFPVKLQMTHDHRIFAIENGEELHNALCLRTAPVFAAGTDAETFALVRNNAVNIVKAFSYLTEYQVKRLPPDSYLSYPDSKIKFDVDGVRPPNTLPDESLNKRLEAVRKHLRSSDREVSSWLKDFYQGWLSLYELFGTPEKLEVVLRFHREVKYRGRRKKVALCYSTAPNHGKSTCARIFQLLYGESCLASSFAGMSAENESNMANPSIVGAAGKTLVFVDEIPAGGRSRGSQISMHKIKLLTGGTSSTGYRLLYSNSETLYYNCALVTFSNNLPQLSETNDADLKRLFPIKFPRQFNVTDNAEQLRKKVEVTCIALDSLLLALEYCAHRAAKDDSVATAAMMEYLTAMNCRRPDGSKFTLKDDARDMDHRMCPDYEECMAKYNEESTVVLQFVKNKIKYFRATPWSDVAQWFKATVFTDHNSVSSKLDSMLIRLRAYFDNQQTHEGGRSTKADLAD